MKFFLFFYFRHCVYEGVDMDVWLLGQKSDQLKNLENKQESTAKLFPKRTMYLCKSTHSLNLCKMCILICTTDKEDLDWRTNSSGK